MLAVTHKKDNCMVKRGFNQSLKILAAGQVLASFPGTEEGEEKVPGTHCLHMRVIIAKATW